ncbi:DUF4240 domain-containing protein [Actinomadura alba]|uniref:DUF4240 domain-containing protein n=1 Tax=Actinomadura alba TaxID=406431 RepID=A0ABR7LW68_9ACTN|nr:DUF4240 domain-containing protein [Actinomadura alba]MBC6469067.1 DUF4240 domain-containing protein [Actinomadura alba]
MDTEDFWSLVESARADDKPFDEALVDRLALRPEEAILGFQERFDELSAAMYRNDVWAAAYLIGGGCSDDAFMDFRSGLIALGREWYEKAARSPDSLAEHPAVIEAAAEFDDGAVFYEEAGYAASNAYERLTGGDEDAFDEAWDRRQDGREDEEVEPDMGENFDFDDEDEMRERLPRLASLYLRQPAHRA